MRNPDFQEIDREFHGAGPTPYEPPKPDLWQRMSKVMEVLLYLLVLAAILRIFWPEVEKQRNLNIELAEVESTLARLDSQVSDLNEEHALLKSDSDYIEARARDRLELAKEGEYVIRIQREEQETAAPRPLPRISPLER